MIVSCLLKPRFKSILITIFMTLHLSACGTEEFLTAIAPEIGSTTEADIDSINHAAKINGVDSGNVIEDVDPDSDNLLEVSGKLNITDSDAGEEAFIAKTVNGDYGVFNIDTAGNWNYAADNQQSAIQNLTSNATLIENLIISSVDGTTHTVKITIIGVIDSVINNNNAAVITGVDSGSVTEDLDSNGDGLLAASGKLNISDRDAGEAAFIAKTTNGNYGNLNININGNWSYGAFNNLPAIQNLNSGATLIDNLTVSSVDGTKHIIRITIHGVGDAGQNQSAVISGADSGSVTEDADPNNDNQLEISGTLNITDSDAGEAAFVAATINGNVGSLTISSTGNWNYVANNNLATIQNLNTGATLTENLIVSSVDGTTHTVVITIVGVNDANSTATVSLSWVAPSTREDNQPISLADIDGYNVYYGTTSGQYPNKVTINDGTATGYTFTNFPTGTHYFVVTTVDTDGRESQYSTVTAVN